MKPYTLKRDILYYAIQGKLVLQDSSEGTGQELLIENNQKKANLSPDLQKRVGKGCKAIQESELPFDIPEKWAWERFGNLVINFDSQRRPVTKSDRKTIKRLYDYYGATGAIDKVDEYIFDGEYLMIGEDGGNFFVDRDNSFIARGAFWANNHVHVVQPIHCNIEYLKVCLDAYDLPNLGLINGIAVPKLNQENMNSILVPLPPLAEQKRIVAKIEELLPLIDRYEVAWSRLEDFNKRFPGDMQKSILQMAIQGKLVEQRPEEGTGEELYRQIQAEKQALIKAGKIKKEKPLPEITEDEIPFEIPESWKWVRLGEIIMDVKDGPHFSPPYQQEGVPFVSTRNVSSGKLDLSTAKYISKELHEEFCKRVRPKKWDVLYTKGGTTGIAAVNDSDTEFSVWVHVAVLSLGSFIYPYYLAMALNSPHCYEQSQEFTHGTSNRDLGLTRMVKITLPLPPLTEQKRIVARLEELLPLCEKLK